MGYKALHALCPHPNKKDEDKPFWQRTHTALMDEDLAAFIKDRNFKITLIPNDNPNVTFVIFPEKEWDNKDDPGDGKGGKW